MSLPDDVRTCWYAFWVKVCVCTFRGSGSAVTGAVWTVGLGTIIGKSDYEIKIGSEN